jgi:F-type H+-transporting ATPase subunit a
VSGSPLEQFVIKPLIPIEVGGVDLSFTNSALWMALGVIAVTLLMTLATNARAAIPGRWQNVAEVFYDFIHGLVDETLGDKGKPYFPFIFTVFMIVLMGNLLGMVPYSFTYTSHIIVTGALALMIFIGVTIVGIVKHGLHFFSLFLPSGLPLPLAPFVVAIEVISYLSRPISLSVRLFVNMMAGHTILKVIAGFSVLMGAAFGVLPMLLNVGLIGLEIMIAFIQAYVFAILSCVYLKDAIELH